MRVLLPIVVPEPDAIDVAWAAGFFDGEGCVRPTAGNRYRTNDGVMRQRRYLRITVTQKYVPLLERMRDIFGTGRIYREKERPTSSAGFQWTCNGRSAFYVVNAMWPHLGELKKADFKQSLKTIRETRTDFVRRPQRGRVLVARKELMGHGTLPQ